ncbi:TPA: Lar family restriction alleviation protein [Stenotrophomonas maltophilia]|nr:Lar family restriction alleviation protein [Stenotrophomonas maltophilia]
MSNDNKTLADVQPGARVRLGDALLPCPFCGAPAERIDFGIGSGENEGGSCIACTVCQHSGPIEFGYKENFISNWNRRALAARQPVGEIPSKVLSAISGLAHVAKANMSSLADKHVAIIDAWLYAAPTAQAVDLSPSHSVLAEVAQERARQEAKWGQQNHVDWTPTLAATDLAGAWPAGAGDHFKFITDYKAKGAEGHRLGYFDILMEEVAEAHDEARDGDTKATRAELVQVAAVAVAWIECIDRRLALTDSQVVGK